MTAGTAKELNFGEGKPKDQQNLKKEGEGRFLSNSRQFGIIIIKLIGLIKYIIDSPVKSCNKRCS